jgi:hypothetical protein
VESYEENADTGYAIGHNGEWTEAHRRESPEMSIFVLNGGDCCRSSERLKDRDSWRLGRVKTRRKYCRRVIQCFIVSTRRFPASVRHNPTISRSSNVNSKRTDSALDFQTGERMSTAENGRQMPFSSRMECSQTRKAGLYPELFSQSNRSRQSRVRTERDILPAKINCRKCP